MARSKVTSTGRIWLTSDSLGGEDCGRHAERGAYLRSSVRKHGNLCARATTWASSVVAFPLPRDRHVTVVAYRRLALQRTVNVVYESPSQDRFSPLASREELVTWEGSAVTAREAVPGTELFVLLAGLRE